VHSPRVLVYFAAENHVDSLSVSVDKLMRQILIALKHYLSMRFATCPLNKQFLLPIQLARFAEAYAGLLTIRLILLDYPAASWILVVWWQFKIF
jgi:hypothetical protein